MSRIFPSTIRICQIFDYYLPLFSGAAIRHNQLSARLRELGAETQVLTQQWDDTSHMEVIDGTPVYRVSQGFTSNPLIQQLFVSLPFCWALWALRKQYDIVHSLSINFFRIPVFLLAKLLGKPVILEFTLIRDEGQSFLAKTLDKLAFFVFRYLDAYVGLSKPLTHEMVSKGLSSSKCYLITPGVDPNEFAPLDPEQRLKKRQELGLKKEARYLIFVGNLLHRKGADVLVEMMGQLHPTYDNLHLIILGAHTFPEDPSTQRFADHLKKRLRDESLESCVHLVGRVEYSEVAGWLQASDIFVFPSRREGLPRSVIQAMSVGLPCICSAMGGVAYSMIESDVSGIIVEDFYPAAFTRQVALLIMDHSLRKRLGINARQAVIDRFDEKRVVTEYRHLYEKVLA